MYSHVHVHQDMYQPFPTLWGVIEGEGTKDFSPHERKWDSMAVTFALSFYTVTKGKVTVILVSNPQSCQLHTWENKQTIPFSDAAD